MEFNLKYYDKNKVGNLISWAGDHNVYNYGSGQVIKFSLVEKLMGSRGFKKIKNDYTVCKNFFGKYILETEFVQSPDKNKIGVIQPKIVGRYLFKSDLKDPFIKKQFAEIMESYDSLISEGHAQIDLVGRGGILQNCFSNIFITPNRELLIIDATLLDFEAIWIVQVVFFIILKLAIWRNDRMIKFFTE